MIYFGIIIATVIATLLALNFTRSEKVLYHCIKHLYGVSDPQFKISIGYLLRPPFLEGNSITPLTNGVEIFPAMLKDIRSAKNSICFETYIYWSGNIGQQFTEALVERANAGIAVHLILDWFGAYRIKKSLQMLKESGAQVQIFHPPRWHTLSRLNNRTHRKLLIIDGLIGYTGGVGIADRWQGNARNPTEWRDTHFRVQGPVVGHLQSSFVDNWIKTSSNVLHGKNYFPELHKQGSSSAQGFSSSAAGGSDSAHLMFLFAIASAKKKILISSAYFIPDKLLINELIAARTRGVEIQIILPGHHTDAKPVQCASRACWGKLLQHGVKFFQFQPTMLHLKIMLIDQLWCTVGSMNFDYRSFHLNFESNLNFFDHELANKLEKQFEMDLAQSLEVKLQDWKNRPFIQKTMDAICSLGRTQF